MLKRITAVLLAAFIVLSVPFSVFASTDPHDYVNQEFLQRAANLLNSYVMQTTYFQALDTLKGMGVLMTSEQCRELLFVTQGLSSLSWQDPLLKSFFSNMSDEQLKKWFDYLGITYPGFGGGSSRGGGGGFTNDDGSDNDIVPINPNDMLELDVPGAVWNLRTRYEQLNNEINILSLFEYNEYLKSPEVKSVFDPYYGKMPDAVNYRINSGKRYVHHLSVSFYSRDWYTEPWETQSSIFVSDKSDKLSFFETYMGTSNSRHYWQYRFNVSGAFERIYYSGIYIEYASGEYFLHCYNQKLQIDCYERFYVLPGIGVNFNLKQNITNYIDNSVNVRNFYYSNEVREGDLYYIDQTFIDYIINLYIEPTSINVPDDYFIYDPTHTDNPGGTGGGSGLTDGQMGFFESILKSILDVLINIRDNVISFGNSIKTKLDTIIRYLADGGVSGDGEPSLLSKILSALLDLPGLLKSLFDMITSLGDLANSLLSGLMDLLKQIFVPGESYLSDRVSDYKSILFSKLPVNFADTPSEPEPVMEAFSTDLDGGSADPGSGGGFDRYGTIGGSVGTGIGGILSGIDDSSGDETAPVFELKIWGETYKLLDFSLFDEYRGLIHSVILFIAYFYFLRRVLKDISWIV